MLDDEQKFIMEGLEEIWTKHPEINFGELIIQIYMGLNSTFSSFQFVKQSNETWAKCIEGIKETI